MEIRQFIFGPNGGVAFFPERSASRPAASGEGTGRLRPGIHMRK